MAAALSGTAGVLRADYLEETGYYALRAMEGDALPDGSTVTVTQVESGGRGYLPEAGEGTFTASGSWFAGRTFRARSGESQASSHARDVAMHFFGANQNPSRGRAGMTPGIPLIDFYNSSGPDADSWLGGAWLRPGSASPRVEIRAVQNHSWITNLTATSAAGLNDSLLRLDYAIVRDGFLCVAAVNNFTGDGDRPPVPALLASAYNVLSVGLTSGGHSSGGTPEGIDGPGRVKPEIVAPLDYTSFATALVSSAGALLRAKADVIGPEAGRPETLKAILLAGATKDEVPGWSNSPDQPLDPLYGAGELNVLHSWRILTGARPSADRPTPDAGWDHLNLDPGESVSWAFRVASGESVPEFSAVAVWNRIVRDADGPGFRPVAEPRTNYDLSWEPEDPEVPDPAAAAHSRSTLENVEHIFLRNVPPGTWRLTLSNHSGPAVPVAVAWRLSRIPAGLPEVEPAIIAGSSVRLRFRGLVPGRTYQVQVHSGSGDWTPAESFAAAAANQEWIDSGAARGRRFYRLALLEAAP